LLGHKITEHDCLTRVMYVNQLKAGGRSWITILSGGIGSRGISFQHNSTSAWLSRRVRWTRVTATTRPSTGKTPPDKTEPSPTDSLMPPVTVVPARFESWV